ncbi:MAG: hypothetical protein M1814_005236 [Vezdaea aestivalis]|nr:MAG: hypothetical protein M1814_005236 [Vezdaea aestivalis]
MGFVDGQNLASIELKQHSPIIKKLSAALSHLAAHTSSIPGPVNAGSPVGYLWSEYGARGSFKSLEDIEVWFNSRLSFDNERLSFQEQDSRFCHLDLARRNIIVRPDNSISLLDWASAGFYPRVFEYWCLTYLRCFDKVYAEYLAEAMESPTKEDVEILTLLNKAYRINQHYVPPEVAEDTIMLLESLPSGSPPQFVPAVDVASKTGGCLFLGE